MGAMAKANPKKQTKKTEAGRDRIRDTNDTVAATCDVLHRFFLLCVILWYVATKRGTGCFSTKAWSKHQSSGGVIFLALRLLQLKSYSSNSFYACRWMKLPEFCRVCFPQGYRGCQDLIFPVGRSTICNREFLRRVALMQHWVPSMLGKRSRRKWCSDRHLRSFCSVKMVAARCNGKTWKKQWKTSKDICCVILRINALQFKHGLQKKGSFLETKTWHTNSSLGSSQAHVPRGVWSQRIGRHQTSRQLSLGNSCLTPGSQTFRLKCLT